MSSHAPQEGPPDLGLTDAAAVGKEVCSWRGLGTGISGAPPIRIGISNIQKLFAQPGSGAFFVPDWKITLKQLSSLS